MLSSKALTRKLLDSTSKSSLRWVSRKRHLLFPTHNIDVPVTFKSNSANHLKDKDDLKEKYRP